MSTEGDIVEVFEDESGDYRWHRQAANGKVTATSGEGYEDLNYTIQMAEENAAADGAEVVITVEGDH